ncbi:hypothetical protein WDW86_18805 [Bdellovibrionota bacterium FG-2]
MLTQCMVKRFRFVFVLGFSVLSFASADVHAASESRNPFFSRCGIGAAYDSYGQGIEAGFRGKSLRPTRDELCYRLGVHEGAALARDEGQECSKYFDEGFHDAFQDLVGAEVSNCYLAGLQAGASALNRGEHEGYQSNR